MMLLTFALAALLHAAPHARANTVRFTVDEASGRIPISAYIYGTNQPDWKAGARNLTLTRLGGNRWTAYNWENNASNAGHDYQNQSDGYLGGGDTPGEAVRPFVADALNAHASVIVTVPIAGYVSADKRADGDVNKTPNFLNTRFNKSLPRKGSAFTYPPDTADKVVYQDEFVAWLEKTFKQSPANRQIFYSLDNEPDIWDSNHARVRTQKLTYAELLQRTIDYGSAIKAAAPGTLIFGPASFGWGGFSNLVNAPDGAGRDFLDFYLAGMRNAEKTHGTRILDALDIHWYPEARGGGKRITEGGNGDDVVRARLQAPRSLWDASYQEDSWITNDVIHKPIDLLPRLQAQIRANYPGTKLAITEYNYGGGSHISGAIAEADVLGIFAREGVFAAAYWNLTQDESFVYGAFAMYRNFDGKDGSFGDTSVMAQTSDAEKSSVYASVDSAHPGRLILVAINKTADALPTQLAIASKTAYHTARRYVLTAASPHPRPGSSPTVSPGNKLMLPLAPMSVTTLVLER